MSFNFGAIGTRPWTCISSVPMLALYKLMQSGRKDIMVALCKP